MKFKLELMTENIDRNIKFYFRKLMKFIHSELHEEGAYMIPLRIFIGIGWLRAAIEKLLDPNWLSGESLTNFINTQISAEQVYFPIYEKILEEIILPNVQFLSILVLVGQLFTGIFILSGTFTNLGLVGGIFMNINFILIGRVSPSAFYVIIQLVLLIGNVGAIVGVDHFLQRRIKYSFLVAQDDFKRRYLMTEKITFLVLGSISILSSFYFFSFIRDFSPHSVDDPAMLLTILGFISGSSFLIAYFRLTPHDIVPPIVDEPMDLVFQVGNVGNFIHWNVDDESPDKYVLIKEGKILKSGYWQTGVIDFNVDFLEAGTHTIILTITDLYGNSNSDSVTVTVYDPEVEEGMSIPHIINQYQKTLRNELENTKSTLDMVNTQHSHLLQVFENNSKSGDENLVSKYSRELTLLSDRKLYLNNSIEGIEMQLEQLLTQQGKIKTS